MLSATTTMRDPRHYLQPYGHLAAKGTTKVKGQPPYPVPTLNTVQANPLYDGARAIMDSPRFVQGPPAEAPERDDSEHHVAIIKRCDPVSLGDESGAEALGEGREFLNVGKTLPVKCLIELPGPEGWFSELLQKLAKLLKGKA